MTSQYRHRRTSNPATPAPNLEPGEIAVNTANRQISVGDAASATLGVPKPLLAIRFFDTAAIYAIGDVVTNAGQIWRALVINGPGAFNAAQWEPAASQVTIASNPPSNAVAGSMWWDSDNGMLYVRYNDGDSSQWVQATAMPVVDTTAFVLKAGDTMTGDLTLSKAGAALRLNKPSALSDLSLAGYNNNSPRWVINLGNGTAETGGNVGADFGISRFSDAGAFLSNPIQISRASGSVFLESDPTAALGIATKQYVDARAGDAMAYSGMQINGGMEVSQEYGSSNSGNFGNVLRNVVDGWNTQSAGAQILTSVQVGVGPQGYANALQILVGTANASPAATDGCIFNQRIEGYRISKLAWGTASAKPITIGFWTYAVRPGNYSGAVANAADDRACPFSFIINAANTWEYKVVTVSGCVDGTWAKNNTTGMNLYFAMMAGSGRQGAANVWANTKLYGVTGTINGVAATTDAFYITGVVVLPGTQAPTAAQSPLLMRPYDQELLTCQRYYFKRNYPVAQTFIASIAAFTTSAASGGLFSLPTTMRAAPTVSTAGLVSMYNAAGAPSDLTSGGYQVTTDTVSANAFTSNAILRAGDAVIVSSGSVANNFHAMDARL